MPKQPNKRKPRRGIAVLLVLGILSITMAMSYAMLRTRTQAELLQDNFSKQNDARLAAEAGLTRGLKAIALSSWAGADVPLSGSLDGQTSYRVTFQYGDASLNSTSANYAEYPYRLTITSIGTAVDKTNSQIQTKYTLKAVVQLVRKKVQDQSSAWTSLLNYTLMQWNAGRSPIIEPLLQVTGNAYLRGIPTVFSETILDDDSLDQYTSDLKKMMQANLGDYRPFTGTLTYPWVTPSSTKSTIANFGNTTSLHLSFATDPPVTHPGSITSYKLYPGGPTYAIPNLSSVYGGEVKDVTLKPDPQTNPLGIYRTTAAIRLGDNANIQGTIISPSTSQTVSIRGKNVVLSGYSLPLIEGTTTARQLPALLANYQVSVETGAQATINGSVMAWDSLAVQTHTSDTKLQIKGRVFANDFDIHGVSDWTTSHGTWTSKLNAFLVQRLLGGLLNSPYMPIWLKLNYDQNPQPTLTISPDSSGVLYHWHDWTQPVYQVASGDDGLRWNVISLAVVP